jgi:shikimate kinase
MARGGKIVWLKGRPETLAERLGDADERPLLRGPTPRIETLRRILQEREVAYATLATHSLDTDAHGVDEIVSQVVEIWRD